MPLTITSISVVLRGSVARDVTALEADGVAIAIAPDRSWSHQATVPSGTTTIALTTFAPTRRETRLIQIGGGSVGAAAG